MLDCDMRIFFSRKTDIMPVQFTVDVLIRLVTKNELCVKVIVVYTRG
jgi:hypothetical protein